MENKSKLTTGLAIAGTALLWLPLLAPFFFGFISFTMDRRFRFDYLMPAELFFVVLAGAALLLWAAFRARSFRRLIGWSLLAGVILLFAGQGVAMLSGLASGAIEPTGIWFAIVLASLVLYDLAVLAAAVGGTLLVLHLFGRSRLAAAAL